MSEYSPQVPEDPTLIELKVHGDGTRPPYYVKVKKGQGAFNILWLAVQVALERMEFARKDA